jgi:hypothetical protein
MMCVLGADSSNVHLIRVGKSAKKALVITWKAINESIALSTETSLSVVVSFSDLVSINAAAMKTYGITTVNAHFEHDFLPYLLI